MNSNQTHVLYIRGESDNLKPDFTRINTYQHSYFIYKLLVRIREQISLPAIVRTLDSALLRSNMI
jgi:hypothetical protein